VLDNQHYGETGMQASHTHAGIDLVGIAKASRFTQALTITQMSEVANVRKLIHKEQGPHLIRALIKNEDVPRVLPSRDGVDVKLKFQRALAG